MQAQKVDINEIQEWSTAQMTNIPSRFNYNPWHENELNINYTAYCGSRYSTSRNAICHRLHRLVMEFQCQVPGHPFQR